MQDYSFRHLFYLPRSIDISGTENPITLPVAGMPTITITRREEKPLQNSKTFTFESSGYRSYEEAKDVGEKVRDALTLAFVHNSIGADFGDGIFRGGLVQHVIDKMRDEYNIRVLNEVHGLMVFETDPPISLMRLPSLTLTLAKSPETLSKDFELAITSSHRLSDREKTSYALFSDSFFASNPSTRLILLVMAVEALVEPQQKSVEAIQYINEFTERIKNAEDLKAEEKQSLQGSLHWLYTESIFQGCKRIINDRLSNAVIDIQAEIKLFRDCYNIRSSLVHGSQPYPSRDEVNAAAAPLEVMVSKLISSCEVWASE